jgi:hypothetical protein
LGNISLMAKQLDYKAKEKVEIALKQQPHTPTP